jgi:group I intron endonuclease
MAERHVPAKAGFFNVYYIECLPTGIGYVGITGWSVARRFARHMLNARHGRAGALYEAVREYKSEAFKVTLLEIVSSWEEACDAERRLIRELGTKTPAGFNLTDGGDGNLGYEYTDEVRLRMSVSGHAKRLSEEHKRKIGDAHRGRKLPPEQVAKLAAAKLGKKASEETREKMRLAHIGRIPVEAIKHNTGSKRTLEQRLRMGAAGKGKKRSAEVRARQSAAALLREEQRRAEGRPHHPGSKSWLGKHHTAEEKAKIGAASRAAWARRKRQM